MYYSGLGSIGTPSSNSVLTASPQTTPNNTNMSQQVILTPPGVSPGGTTPTTTHHHHSLTSFTGIDEAKQWLLNNRFGPYVSLFANYSGVYNNSSDVTELLVIMCTRY